MNRKTLQRCLALVLTVCMVMGIFVGTVSAADEVAKDSVTVTATKSVVAATNGHYPVEFVLTNTTTTEYSVSLVKTAGDAAFNYRGTSADNGTIKLDANTEQKVSGYLTFTDAANQQADVTVEVRSGSTVLETLTIDVSDSTDMKVAVWNFDGTAEGWTGGSFWNGHEGIHMGARDTVTYGKNLKLESGHLYRLTFRAKADNEGDAFFARVSDFDAQGKALAVPMSLRTVTKLTKNYQKFEYRFVVNTADDANYSYSTLSFESCGADNVQNLIKGIRSVDDVVLVDCGPAAEIEVINGSFEDCKDSGAKTAAQFANWSTGSLAHRGTTIKPVYGKNPGAYEGAEMMHVDRGYPDYKYTEQFFTTDEEVLITYWGYAMEARNFGGKNFEAQIMEYATEEATTSANKVYANHIRFYAWQSNQIVYQKPADVAKFRVGLRIYLTEEWGNFLDHVTMYECTAASNITDSDIAAAGYIEGYVPTASSGSGSTTVPPLPAMAAPVVTRLAYTMETLTAALKKGGSVKLIDNITVNGAVNVTGVNMNGKKLTLAKGASVTGAAAEDVKAASGYELVETDGVYTVQKKISGTITHVGRSLSLDGVIYINQYVKITGFTGVNVAENGGLLVFENPVSEEEATYENADAVRPGLIQSGDNYVQQSHGIPAKKYADELYLRVYVKDAQGEYTYSPVMPYSVQEYCESRLTKSSNEDMKKLCAAMLHYGAAAQDYFKYNAQDPANANILNTWPADEWDSGLLTALKGFTTSITGSGDVKSVGKTLSLDGAIKVNFYFQPDGWTVEKAELMVWDGVTRKLTYNNITYTVPMTEDSGNWVGSSEEFAAKEMGKTIYAAAKFTDTEGKVHCSDVIAYSPEAYAEGRINNSTNAKMVELAKRMVIYGDYAAIYFGWKDDTAAPEQPEESEKPEDYPSISIPDDMAYGNYIVYDGQPQAHIMLTENATDLEVMAAEELQYHVELVTGAKLPINYVDPAETGFTVYAEPSVVYAPEKGYYPVEFTLKNPTADKMEVVLSQKADSEMEPVLTIRGDNANDGVVTLEPYTQKVVTGHFTVEDAYVYPTSVVEVEAVVNGEVFATMEVNFAARTTAVDNADFEAAQTGWNNGIRDTAVHYEGEASMKIAAGSTASYGKNIKMLPGHMYYLGFYATGDTIGAAVKATVTDFNTAGAALTVPMSLNTRSDLQRGAWSWHEFRFVANTAEDAAYLYSQLSLNGTSGNVWVDGMVLIDCGEATEDYINNGDFETYDEASTYGFTGWWISGGYRGESTTDTYAGQKAANLGGSTATIGALPMLNAAATYTISFWAKALSSGARIKGSANPMVNWQSYGQFTEQTYNISDQWERYEFVLKTPVLDAGTKYNGTYMTFYVTGSVLMDHVEIHEADDAFAMSGDLELGKMDAQIQLNHKTGFENGADGWTGTVAASGHDSAASMKVAANGTAKLNNSVSMLTEHLYRLGFWAKADVNGAEMFARVSDYDAAGNALATPMSLNNRTVLTKDWTYYEYRFIGNAAGIVTYAQSVLSFHAGSGNVWVDDVVLVDCGAASANVLPNSDFEEPYNNQSAYTPNRYPGWWMHTHSEKPVKGYSGAQAASFHCIPSKEPLGCRDLQYTVKEDTTFSAWVKGTPVTEEGRIEFYVVGVKGGNASNIDRLETHTSYLSGDWERIEFTIHKNEEWLTKYTSIQVLFTPYDLDTYSPAMDLTSLRSTQVAADLPLDGTIPESEEPDVAPMVTPMPEEPEILTPTPNSLSLFLVTPDSYPALKSAFAEDLEWIGDSDGFAIRQRGGVIYIFGTEPRGTLNGAYDFIEENLDLIWFRADDTAYDPMKTVTPDSVNYREKAPFEVRALVSSGTGDDGSQMTDAETDLMFSRNKINAKHAPSQNYERWPYMESIGLELFKNNHNVTQLIMESPLYDPTCFEYWNTDEEGNYITDDFANPIKYQINYFSQLTIDAAAARVLQQVAGAPDEPYVAIGMNDCWYSVNKPYSDMPFEYEPGKFVYPEDENYMSTVFFTWLTKVGEKVWAEYPDVKIVTMAYYFNEYVPACEIPENVYIVFCPLKENLKESYFTDKEGDPNQLIYKNLMDWTAVTKNLLFWNYYGCFTASPRFERPIAKRVQQDMQFYAEMGYTGPQSEIPTDATGTKSSWDMNQLTWWMIQKLIWNPYDDVDALTEYYCDKVYGPASEGMQEYYKYLTAGWDENDGRVYVTTTTQEYLDWFILNSGYVMEMQDALNKAWNATEEGSIYRERMRYIRDTFTQTVLSASNIKIEEGTALYTTAGKDAVLAATDFTSDIWAEAQVLENLYENTTLERMEEAVTKVRLLWDEDYFYVGYEMFDTSIDNIKAPDKYNGDGTWFNGKSDDVETFITVDPSKENYYQYSTNPMGIFNRWMVMNGYKRHDAEGKNPNVVKWSFTTEIRNEEGVENDKWICIQAISWDSLGLEGKATKDTDVFAYFYRMYVDDTNYENQIAWNGALVWNPRYFRQIELRTEPYVPEAPDTTPDDELDAPPIAPAD